MNSWADTEPRPNHLGSACCSTTKLHKPAPEGAESRPETMTVLMSSDRSGGSEVRDATLHKPAHSRHCSDPFQKATHLPLLQTWELNSTLLQFTTESPEAQTGSVIAQDHTVFKVQSGD